MNKGLVVLLVSGLAYWYLTVYPEVTEAQYEL